MAPLRDASDKIRASSLQVEYCGFQSCKSDKIHRYWLPSFYQGNLSGLRIRSKQNCFERDELAHYE